MNKRVVENFYKYIAIDSESKNERAIADCLKEDLVKLGFEVREDEAGNASGGNAGNVIGVLKGNPSKETILLSAHMDTVMPGVGIIPVCNDGIITSQGDTILGGDDKAGISCIIEGITKVVENKEDHGDIEVVFSISEEIGLIGVKNLDFSSISSKRAYVFDSSGDIGGIITAAPSQTKIKVKVNGKAAHAGVEPEKGVSAINILADAISNMKLLRIDDETTANVGTIAGGTATNIVAECAEALIEVRSLSMDKLKQQNDHIIDELKKSANKFGGSVETTIDHLYPSFKLDDNEDIVTSIKAAMIKVGIESYTRSTGGGSDTNIYNSKGIKAVNINIGSSNVHSLKEQISVDSLEKVSELVHMLIVDA